MPGENLPPFRLSRGSLADLHWTPAQLLTHHASNGVSLRLGDLPASGTVSGEAEGSRGWLPELTRLGQNPVALPGGEMGRFLEDEDDVVPRAWYERPGFARIGFGECRGRVLSAHRHSRGSTPC